jgi:hypothetical protein
MPAKYRIREGFSFAMGDGTVKTGGSEIELDEDTATNHIHKLELLVPVTKKTAGSGKKIEAKDDASELPLAAATVIDPVAESGAPLETSPVTDPV